MTRRRAIYSPGEGLLSVDRDRLLFMQIADHAAVAELAAAARSDRPLRLLAAAIVAADFDVPPFVFIHHETTLRGMACGAIEVEVAGVEESLVRGDAADTWTQFHGSAAGTVSLGDEVVGDLWIEVGIVRADAFRWAIAEEPAISDAPAEPSSLSPSQAQDSAGADSAPSHEPDQRRAGVSSLGVGASEPPKSEPGHGDETIGDATLVQPAGDIEGDPTIVAPRLGAAQGASATASGSRVPAFARRLTGSRATTPEHTDRREDPEEAEHRSVSEDGDTDSTLDLEPGEVLVAEASPRRTVEARVCLSCDHPNPPTAIRCRACNASIAESGGEIRVIAQPILGTIHLSGDQVESLDMDLLIGRNPAREPLKPHQRAVVHGKGDRSVSRRHVELRLDGWQVVVTNLKADEHTIVESSRGHQTPLPHGVSRTLEDGDTVRYGGSWLRYEEGR